MRQYKPYGGNGIHVPFPFLIDKEEFVVDTREEKKRASWRELAEHLAQREIRYPADLIAGILFLVIAGVLALLLPSQVFISEKDIVNGRAFPILLISLMALMSTLLIGKELYKLAAKEPLTMRKMNLLVELKAACIIVILIVTYLLAKMTELFIVGALFCSVAFLVYFGCRRKLYYGITLVLAVLIWAVFRFALGVEF